MKAGELKKILEPVPDDADVGVFLPNGSINYAISAWFNADEFEEQEGKGTLLIDPD